MENQPGWIDLLQLDHVFDDYSTDFQFDDGGPGYDWSAGRLNYPQNAQESFESLSDDHNEGESLQLPTVNLQSMNADQRFAYSLVMDTFIRHSKARMLV